jgi:hypothetical protein
VKFGAKRYRTIRELHVFDPFCCQCGKLTQLRRVTIKRTRRQRRIILLPDVAVPHRDSLICAACWDELPTFTHTIRFTVCAGEDVNSRTLTSLEESPNSTTDKHLRHRRDVKCPMCSPNRGCNRRAKKKSSGRNGRKPKTYRDMNAGA